MGAHDAKVTRTDRVFPVQLSIQGPSAWMLAIGFSPKDCRFAAVSWS
jgi:hypothetical protein